jgi:hypothetical protein
MTRDDLITYEELPAEHKQKYDEIQALFKADLIGSFEKTRHHDVRWKGFSPEGALDGAACGPGDHEASILSNRTYLGEL